LVQLVCFIRASDRICSIRSIGEMSAISQRRGHLPAALTRARVLSRALLLQKSTSSERFPFLLDVPTSIIGCRGGRNKNSGHKGAGKIAKLSG
jgi:hypothetical protein